MSPGTTNKRDESRQRVLKEFPYSVVSEERRAYLEGEMNKIYHHMPLEYYDPAKTDYECLIAFHERNIGTSWTERPLDQQAFVKYKMGSSVGCEHYIRGCDVQCQVCKKFYHCRLCHDDQ